MGGEACKQFFYFELPKIGISKNRPSANSGSSESASASGERLRTFSDWIETLDFEELVFWSFKKSARSIRWEYSLQEIIKFSRSRVAEKQMEITQEFEVLATLAKMILGGSDKEAKKEVVQIKNKSQLLGALNEIKS